MLSPTTTACSMVTPRRSAAARNRSGSGLACATWSRVTIGTPSGHAERFDHGAGRLPAAAGGDGPGHAGCGEGREQLAAPGSGRTWSGEFVVRLGVERSDAVDCSGVTPSPSRAAGR